MNIARSSLKLFLANIANAGIQFIGIVYFARILGSTQMGIFFLFQVVLGLLTIPADFGVRGAVKKRISEGKFQGEYLSSAIAFKLLPISVIILCILLVRSYLENYIGTAVAVPLIIALLLQEALKLSTAVLSGELRVGETAILKVTRNTTWVLVGSVLIAYGLEADAIIYGLVAGMGVSALWGWYKVSIPLKEPSLIYIRSLFDYSKYSFISSVGGYLYNWTDVAIIGLFLTQAAVGAYEIAWRVSAISLLFSRAIASTIFPQVSEWEANDAQEHIEGLITRSITPSLFLVIPAFFGTVLFSEEILSIVFDEEYTIAASVLILLMGDKVFQAVHLIIGKSLQAINKPDLAARAAIASLIVNIGLNIIFVLQFGIIGAAFATVISSLLNDLLHFLYLRRFISVSFPKREMTECVLASGIMGVILYGFTITYTIQNLPELTFVVLLGIIIYTCTVLLMPNLRFRIYKAIDRIGILP